jgi:prevent-host-death family protein
MGSVGVRELRQRASELLRRVEAGETIEVTDRGRPVALLTPINPSSGLERLRAEGDTVPAKDDFETLPSPMVLPQGARSASQHLADLRASER